MEYDPFREEMKLSYLAELARKDSISSDRWIAWVRWLAFTRDLDQLPMDDQDRVFRVVA